MSVDRFERLLKEVIGLDAASIGSSAIERAVRTRQRLTCSVDLTAYWELVTGSDAERQHLVDEVVVPETWFFRDREAFAALARLVQHELTPSHPDGVFRLLSAPCATGEEPYSMAMALLDAGVSDRRFRVDAIDVSDRTIADARRGIYGRNSFRGADTGFRDRFFTAYDGRYEVHAGVRHAVRFQRANLFSPSFLADRDRYDVIFCRNLLIYFDRETRDRAVGVLDRLLAPLGVLFVGASETSVFADHDFRSARLTMAFAFRRAAATPEGRGASNAAAVAQAVRARAPRPLPPAVRPPAVPVRSAPPPAMPRDPSAHVAATLAEARRLADQGHFVEAARLCENGLKTHGPNADVFYLLGIVRDASGNHAEAERFYRRALYVDPTHIEAIMHLALLMDTQGKTAEADVLRKRVRRLDAAQGGQA
jgi:chemotaxis protein methyltransferase WspC